jgi:hypothetical protein
MWSELLSYAIEKQLDPSTAGAYIDVKGLSPHQQFTDLSQ